jgi:hypothetical protein
MKQENYQDLLSQFKVEELKERLEFDMAGGGWSYEAKPKIKPKFENTKPKGVEAGAEIHFNWQP